MGYIGYGPVLLCGLWGYGSWYAIGYGAAQTAQQRLRQIQPLFFGVCRSLRTRHNKKNMVLTTALFLLQLANILSDYISYALTEVKCKEGCFSNHWFRDRRFFLGYTHVYTCVVLHSERTATRHVHLHMN